MEAKPQYWRKRAISFDPKDINDPANAPYLYEGPDGKKFIDWNNPGHKLEKWAERINVLAGDDEEQKYEYYKQIYYNRLVKQNRIGPDYSSQDSSVEEKEDQSKIVDMPPARLPVPANQMLDILRGLKEKIKMLEAQKYALALAAGYSGCPETGNPNCPLRAFDPKKRDSISCAQCWMKWADKCGTKIEAKKS